MKDYFIRYGEFRNQYDLSWADTIKDGNRLKAAGFVPSLAKRRKTRRGKSVTAERSIRTSPDIRTRPSSLHRTI